MRTATVLSAFVAAGLTVGAATAEAQSGQIQATASVLSAITVNGQNDLAFGNVTPGVNKTIAIADPGAGRFQVLKAAGEAVTLSFTLPTDLSSGVNTMPIAAWTGGWNTIADPGSASAFTPGTPETTTPVAGTEVYVYVGATVQPAAAQAAGNYSADVAMSVVYF